MSWGATVLTGSRVRLDPLEEIHREALKAAADDDSIWEHMTVLARGSGFDAWFDAALAELNAGRRHPFAVRRHSDGALIGSTSYLDPMPAHLRVEIGSTWYMQSAWGNLVNPECKYLLLAHAFETLGLNRVSFCTDLRNTRSQAAIAKLGAIREGVLRYHMITQGGRVRDTVLFSIIAADWPKVKAGLEGRLSPAAKPA
jgi:RimJ/RimL family protein N-acetyltransferase